MYDVQIRPKFSVNDMDWRSVGKVLTEVDADNVKVHFAEEYPEFDVRVVLGEFRD